MERPCKRTQTLCRLNLCERPPYQEATVARRPLDRLCRCPLGLFDQGRNAEPELGRRAERGLLGCHRVRYRGPGYDPCWIDNFRPANRGEEIHYGQMV